MKKLIALAALSFVLSASALEVGINTSRITKSPDNQTIGLTVGQKFGSVGITAGLDHVYNQSLDQNRFSLVGSYDFAKLGPVSLNLFAGGAYSKASSVAGYSTIAGVGGQFDLTKNIALVADVRNTRAVQTKVSGFNANSVTAGLKYSF